MNMLISSFRRVLPALVVPAAFLLAACGSERKPEPAASVKTVAPPSPAWRAIDSTLQERPVSDTLAAREGETEEAALPVYRAEPDTLLELEEDMSGMCSLGCAVGWNVTASSHLPAAGKNRYEVGMLDDGLPATAWVEGNEGSGAGERIVFSFPATYFEETEGMKDIPFWGFMIVNGYHKSPNAWRENGRAKRLRLLHNGKPLFVIALQDVMGAQSVGFPSFPINTGDEVALEVLDVYPGERYSDMAISELLPMGAH